MLRGIFLVLILPVLMLGVGALGQQSRVSREVRPLCGKPVRGLELCLQKTSNPQELQLRIHNIGTPIAVGIGMELPTGVRFATAVSLIAVDASGHSYHPEVTVVPGVIGGNLKSFVIQLQRNEFYNLPILLTKYEEPRSRFRFDLTKSYSVRAQLTGEGTTPATAAALWRGNVRSNAVKVGSGD